jgi:hypothetical protein
LYLSYQQDADDTRVYCGLKAKPRTRQLTAADGSRSRYQLRLVG